MLIYSKPMRDIQITLEPCKSIYYPGDAISGHVIVKLSEETKINEVYLQIKGQAHISFWHGYGNDRHRYTNKHVYFNEHITLWQRNEEKGEKSLSAGVKQYPFSFIIPYDAAPSLNGTHGNIKYRLKAELNIPWQFDKNIKQEIIMANPIYLNSNPAYNQPYSSQIQKGNSSTSSNFLHATVSFIKVSN